MMKTVMKSVTTVNESVFFFQNKNKCKNFTAVSNLFDCEDPFLCSTDFHEPPHTNIVVLLCSVN